MARAISHISDICNLTNVKLYCVHTTGWSMVSLNTNRACSTVMTVHVRRWIVWINSPKIETTWWSRFRQSKCPEVLVSFHSYKNGRFFLEMSKKNYKEPKVPKYKIQGAQHLSLYGKSKFFQSPKDKIKSPVHPVQWSIILALYLSHLSSWGIQYNFDLLNTWKTF